MSDVQVVVFGVTEGHTVTERGSSTATTVILNIGPSHERITPSEVYPALEQFVRSWTKPLGKREDVQISLCFYPAATTPEWVVQAAYQVLSVGLQHKAYRVVPKP